MPEQEPQATICLKKLNLITPNYAQSLGLRVTSPILTSFSDSGHFKYQVGEVTEYTGFFDPQDTGGTHTKEPINTEGNIKILYSHPSMGLGFDQEPLFVTTNGCSYYNNMKLSGFIAVVEPLGEVTEWEDYFFAYNRITNRLRVKELQVYCVGCLEGPLTEGSLLDWQNGYLRPSCDAKYHRKDFKRLETFGITRSRFRIDTDGSLTY